MKEVFSTVREKYHSWKLKRPFDQVQRSYSKKVKNLRKYVRDKHKLRVAFLVIFSSVFPSETVYQKMLNDDVFDPYIIVVPDMQRSDDYKLFQYRHTFQELYDRYGERVLNGMDIDSDTYLELEDDYQIVFFSNPYPWMAHEYHHINYFLDRDVLLIYINYGFPAVKYGQEIFSSDFCSLLWKCCVDSEINLYELKEFQLIKGKNALLTGYLKMDRLSDEISYPRERKKIILCPHHTVMGWQSLDISNFMVYYDFFLELPTIYPDIDFVFRPHPLLFYNLIENGIWNREKVNQYLDRIENIPNMVYDDSGDYMSLFANSDAMIHDCGSFIGEYLFTEKPCCYMLKSEEELGEVFNPMGIACLEHYYKAFSREDILEFIDNVIVGGNDPLKDARETFSRKELKFNYPNAAECVLNTIKDALKIAGEDSA